MQNLVSFRLEVYHIIASNVYSVSSSFGLLCIRDISMFSRKDLKDWTCSLSRKCNVCNPSFIHDDLANFLPDALAVPWKVADEHKRIGYCAQCIT